MPQVQRNRLNALNSQLVLTGKNLYQKNSLLITQLKERMYPDVQRYYQHQKESVERSTEMIDSLGPLSVMRRGYSVSLQNNRVIRTVDDIDENREMETRLKDGVVVSRPLRKEKYHG